MQSSHENATLSGVSNSHWLDRDISNDRAWISEALKQLDADSNRSSDTHLIKPSLGRFENIDLYLKDESTHPTGSLKHRLARSLILYGLVNGKIDRSTALIEASSGSTAVSEAYFAKLLGLNFIAVVPFGTSEQKLDEIRRYGGSIHEVEASHIYDVAAQLADDKQGYYLDQFTNAERVTDWRGNNNIAESLFKQMRYERFPSPAWIVVGAGTGGTSATIGRYIRYQSKQYTQTRLCVADPENSVFFDGYKANDAGLTQAGKSRIEGVGRPRMEPSFLGSVVDRMTKIDDAASIATIWWLEKVTGRRFGPSTGLNVYASLLLALEMEAAGEAGSIVSLGCDIGSRYRDTCFNSSWLEENGLDISPYLDELESLMA